MRVLAFVYCGPDSPVTAALGDASAVSAALDQLARLPALRRRRLLSSYAALARKAFGSPGDVRSGAATKSTQKAGMAVHAPPERVLEKGSQ